MVGTFMRVAAIGIQNKNNKGIWHTSSKNHNQAQHTRTEEHRTNGIHR